MDNDRLVLTEEQRSSKLYSPDLGPIPVEKRTWGLWDMAAIWVGMAVCIPTYLLASYMIRSGLSWIEALVIIALGNLIITIPMVLNGHAGVKYGIPFPVIGRASFGINGIHIPAVVRGIVACGWFGIQTWIGGLAFYEIWHALNGTEPSTLLDIGKFIGFALFWCINVYFILKGTESIKWLEKFAAPILIGIGILLIIWGSSQTGGFAKVLQQSSQLANEAAILHIDDNESTTLSLHPLKDKTGAIKAREYKITYSHSDRQTESSWHPINEDNLRIDVLSLIPEFDGGHYMEDQSSMNITYRNDVHQSSSIAVSVNPPPVSWTSKFWSYLLWLTAMVGFWATMAISIADITRFTRTQKNQIRGQFIGLPGTMALFSFVGIFVTCAAAINFQDILIAEDAPWDPVTLLGKFENPMVVIIAQIFMLIATLSTNIAANVIAPANAFSNIWPSKISFQKGGLITAIIGILIAPWWLLDDISGLLIFVSGFLGPVLGILLCDYFIINKKSLQIGELFNEKGIYRFGTSGYNPSAMVALGLGIVVALVGLFMCPL